MDRRGFAAPFILIGVLLLLLVGGSAYYRGKSAQPGFVIPSPAALTSTPSVVDETNKFATSGEQKNCESDRNSQELQKLRDYLKVNVDIKPTESHWCIFTYPQTNLWGGYSLLFPAKWEFTSAGGAYSTDRIAFSIPVKLTSGGNSIFYVYVIAVVDTKGEIKSLDDYVKASLNLAYAKDATVFDKDQTVLNKTKQTINGKGFLFLNTKMKNNEELDFQWYVTMSPNGKDGKNRMYFIEIRKNKLSDNIEFDNDLDKLVSSLRPL